MMKQISNPKTKQNRTIPENLSMLYNQNTKNNETVNNNENINSNGNIDSDDEPLNTEEMVDLIETMENTLDRRDLKIFNLEEEIRYQKECKT